jgi:hypothetical protein
MEDTVKEIRADKVVRTRNPETEDSGKVRLGLLSPLFPPVRSEPGNVADGGKVRLGLTSPTFPPVPSR